MSAASVTLLMEREGAKDVGALASTAGLTGIWCPLDGGRTSTPPEAVSSGLAAAKVGMFGYARLRYTGLDRESARATLRELRVVTAEGVGADPLDLGDRVADMLAPR